MYRQVDVLSQRNNIEAPTYLFVVLLLFVAVLIFIIISPRGSNIKETENLNK